MTRHTRVAVLDAGLSPVQMWTTMATLIRAPEHYRFDVSSDGIHADLAQGLDALLWLDFRGDGSQIPADQCEDDLCFDTPCDRWLHDPAHYLMAHFDTAYSYTGSCGCHSGGLHLRLVAGLGAWLDDQGVRWAWYDESGDCWNHDHDWGTLAGDGTCSQHRAIAPPRNVLLGTDGRPEAPRG